MTRRRFSAWYRAEKACDVDARGRCEQSEPFCPVLRTTLQVSDGDDNDLASCETVYDLVRESGHQRATGATSGETAVPISGRAWMREMVATTESKNSPPRPGLRASYQRTAWRNSVLAGAMVRTVTARESHVRSGASRRPKARPEPFRLRWPRPAARSRRSMPLRHPGLKGHPGYRGVQRQSSRVHRDPVATPRQERPERPSSSCGFYRDRSSKPFAGASRC